MTATSLRRLTALCGILAFVLLSLPALAAPMTWTLGGYIQPRFTDTLGSGLNGTVPGVVDSTPMTFNDSRVAFLVRAKDGEHVFLQVFIASVGKDAGRSTTTLGNTPNGNSTFQIQHAFAEYIEKDYHLRLGLSPVPFGYENPITSCMLITTERSQVSTVLFSKVGKTAENFSLDHGLYAYYLPKDGFNVSLGVTNGQPVDVSSDTENGKTIVARVGYFIPGGQVGVSYYNGKRTEPIAVFAPELDMKRLGADLQTVIGPFTILGEYIAGTDGTIKSQGGYLTGAYQPAGSPHQEYLRVDTYNPNTNPLASTYYERATAGYCYFINPTSKAQVEYQAIKDNANPGMHGSVTLQYQIIF